MDNTEKYKHIDFSKWCPTCIYLDDEESDPYLKCNDCLAEGARINTQKPLNYIKREGK